MSSNLPSIDEICGENAPFYEKCYSEVDPTGAGKISAPTAAGYLKRSQFTNAQLAMVWELSDYNHSGSLDKLGFFMALKLVALAQNGHEVNVANLTIETPPPRLVASSAVTPSIPHLTGTPQDEWAIGASDRQKYMAIFNSLDPINGKLGGAKVQPVLLNSGLPNATLAKIWELSDIDADGNLTGDEMCVALHLVYRCLEGESAPAMLHPALIPPSMRAAYNNKRRVSGAMSTATPPPRPPSVARPPSTTGDHEVQAVMASQPPARPPSQPIRPPSGAALSGSNTPHWPVNAIKHASLFTQLDTNVDGFVNGTDVKGVLMQSGLDTQALAQIWTLVDIQKNGALNQEQFALTMHLIEQCRETSQPPPSTLPAYLMPPSLRSGSMPGFMTSSTVPIRPAEPVYVQPNTVRRRSFHIQSVAPLHLTKDIALTSRLGAQPSETTVSGDVELNGIINEIENLNFEKRDVEQSMQQLHADMVVKQSEIKNLALEFNTLDTTVQRLEHQKKEADRRLADMDTQREALMKTLEEMKSKLSADEKLIEETRDEIEKMKASEHDREAEMARMQEQLDAVTAEEEEAQQKLRSEQSQLYSTEQDVAKCENMKENRIHSLDGLRHHTDTLQKRLDDLQAVLDSGDMQTLVRRQGQLLQNVYEFEAPHFENDDTIVAICTSGLSFDDTLYKGSPEVSQPGSKRGSIAGGATTKRDSIVSQQAAGSKRGSVAKQASVVSKKDSAGSKTVSKQNSVVSKQNSVTSIKKDPIVSKQNSVTSTKADSKRGSVVSKQKSIASDKGQPSIESVNDKPTPTALYASTHTTEHAGWSTGTNDYTQSNGNGFGATPTVAFDAFPDSQSGGFDDDPFKSGGGQDPFGASSDNAFGDGPLPDTADAFAASMTVPTSHMSRDISNLSLALKAIEDAPPPPMVTDSHAVEDDDVITPVEKKENIVQRMKELQKSVREASFDDSAVQHMPKSTVTIMETGGDMSDPFASAPVQSPGSPSKPSRPAPPKAAAATDPFGAPAKDDPFGGSSATSGGGFADFDAFS